VRDSRCACCASGIVAAAEGAAPERSRVWGGGGARQGDPPRASEWPIGGHCRSFFRCESACARARSAARSAAQRRAKFSSAARWWAGARAGGRGRGGAQSAARRGVRRVGVGEGAAACRSTTKRCGDVFLGACRRGRKLGGLSSLQVHSPASWQCFPRRVSAWAKDMWPVALSTPGGRGRYWAAQWHLARAVGKRFRGCRAKRLYVYNSFEYCSSVFTPLEATYTGPSFNWGSGGGARGYGFDERVQ